METLKEEISQWLTYIPENGDLIWRKQENPLGKPYLKRFNSIYAGKKAGWVDNDSRSDYSRIRVNFKNKTYGAHNLGWLLYYGYMPSETGKVIDHIDGDSTNNSIENLRLVTQEINSKNKRRSSNNTSGYPGVHWHKTKEKWVVRITDNKRRREVGSFNNLDEAILYRKSLEQDFGYHENHGRD